MADKPKCYFWRDAGCYQQGDVDACGCEGDERYACYHPPVKDDPYKQLAAACSAVVGDCPDAPGFPSGPCEGCGRKPICEALQKLDEVEGRK